jgi:hypothetical protein
MLFQDENAMREAGFTGFRTVNELWRDSSVIPKVKGVYFVLYPGREMPEFEEIGTGGYFKGREPNVPLDVLRSNWVDGVPVIYIGKAGGTSSTTGIMGKATLQKRILQYLRFGHGEDVGHYGGRLIWQIKDPGNLIFCWKPLRTEEPRAVESALIRQFLDTYHKLPFANLTG